MKPNSSTETPDTSDDAQRLTQADFDRASFRLGGKTISRADWQAAVRARVEKQRINIMLDAPIIEHFKSNPDQRHAAAGH